VLVAIGVIQPLGEVDHVGALVPILRQLHGLARDGAVARLHRGAEELELRVVRPVVHVVLALNLVAAGIEKRRQGIAIRAATRVADVDRSHRVGAHELHLHPLARAALAAAEPVILLAREADHRLQPGIGQTQVDEPRTGDLCPRDHIVLRQMLNDALRHLARLGLRLGRDDHGDIARQVAMLGVLGGGDNDLGLLGRDPPVGRGSRHGLGKQFLNLASYHQIRPL